MYFEMLTGAVGAVVASYAALKIFCPWVFEDIKYLKRVKRILGPVRKYVKSKTLLVDIFEQRVQEKQEQPFVLFEGREFSYKHMNEEANRFGRAMLKLGLHRGDTVAVMMYNEPAYLWIYFGLQKIGVRMACINHNLRSKSLRHCIKAVDPKLLILGEGPELQSAVRAVMPDLRTMRFLMMGPDSVQCPAGFESVASLMEGMSGDDIDKEARRDVNIGDISLYIFTSGTTGLPKAAQLPHQRVLTGAHFSHPFGVTSGDRLYVTLPLYHTSAMSIAVGGVVTLGSTMVLRRKFSATEFWSDCRKYDVGAFLYIGELCRYLLAKPESSSDKDHKVRVAFGNGLRRDIYEEFQTRFGIPVIGEFYAATEGNSGFLNCLNATGAVGRCSPLLQKFLADEFIKFDVDAEEPVRGKDGFCIRAELGEPGLLVGRVNKEKPFDGYKGQEELNEKKRLRNVFKKDDLYFNSGDLLYRDKHYNVYFSDRVGDTFRWKAENVASIEVSNTLAELEFVADAVVFGVEVPGCDGRAGMAALNLTDGARKLSEGQLRAVQAQCEEYLPAYARPLFLRVQPELEVTSTFKQTKIHLKQEAFNKEMIRDELYYLHKATGAYRVLDAATYQCIMNKNLAF